MEVSRKSNLSKLFATKIQSPPSAEKSQKTSARSVADNAENGLNSGVRSTLDAAATISSVAVRIRSSSGKPNSPSQSPQDREEVEKAVKAASQSSVEDVSALADALADRIRQNPKQAVEAHNLTSKGSVQVLR